MDTTAGLEGIRVASPCKASWEDMRGDDRVRHCGLCRLNVYNLSAMTRGEAERLVASREGRLCVRFYRRADGTLLTEDCPRGLAAARRRLALLASGLAASLAVVLGIGALARARSTGGNPWDAEPLRTLARLLPASWRPAPPPTPIMGDICLPAPPAPPAPAPPPRAIMGEVRVR